MSSDELAASKMLDVWYSVDDQNISLRTAILKPKALEAIHKMNRLNHKLLLFVSLPEGIRKEYLTKEWSKYESIIQELKTKALKEKDSTLLREANIMTVKLDLAKRYNTLPNFIDKIAIFNNLLAKMINATSAIEGKTFYGLLGSPLSKAKRGFSLFSKKDEEESE